MVTVGRYTDQHMYCFRPYRCTGTISLLYNTMASWTENVAIYVYKESSAVQYLCGKRDILSINIFSIKFLNYFFSIINHVIRRLDD